MHASYLFMRVHLITEMLLVHMVARTVFIALWPLPLVIYPLIIDPTLI